MNEKLTVVLFRNHLTSRTFEVSLKKLERIGISFVIAIFLALFSALFFVRAGVKMMNTEGGRSLQRAEELEKQLAEMRTSYEALQSHISGTSNPGSAITPSSMRSILFTSIPTASLRSPIPSRDSLPFRLDSLKAHWQGNFLNVTTAIEYTRGDEGTQQGNFFLMAQGPQNLYAHPEGAFGEAGAETLMEPESGEYFSVARYREVRARFGPVERHDQITNISILLFDRNKNLIYFDRIALKDAEPAAESKSSKRPPREKTPEPSDEATDSGAAEETPASIPEATTPSSAPSSGGNAQ